MVKFPIKSYRIFKIRGGENGNNNEEFGFKRVFLTAILKKFIVSLPIIFFLFSWLFLIRPAWLGQLSSTFKARKVPAEYVNLKDFIHRQPEFFRTFWIPKRQRFGFFSNNHPAIDAVDFLKVGTTPAVVDWLHGKEAKEQLSRWSVKYLIVPYDSEGEIFLKDRKYDDSKRQEVVDSVAEVDWLIKLPDFKEIAVFETPEHFDKFWTTNPEVKIKWERINPTKYKVEVKETNEPFILVFSENFAKKWIVEVDGEKIYSQKTDDGLNSFTFNRRGSYNIEVYYEPQRYVNYGLMVSVATLVSALVFFLKGYLRKR